MFHNIQNLLPFLACPYCLGDLTYENNRLFCNKCQVYYEIINTIPVLLTKETLEKVKSTELEIYYPEKSWFKKIGDKISVHWLDKSPFEFVNNLDEKSLILNLGSGRGIFDGLIKKEMINLDINIYKDYTDIVGDAHQLPLKSGLFDCIFCQAVLEHVPRPWKVSEEIHRILKPGGYAIISVPFLGALHDKNDYYRFSEQGLEEIFCQFKKIKTGVNTGPFNFLINFIPYIFYLIMPIKFIKKMLLYITAILIWPLKFLDILFIKNKEVKIIGTSVYFIGQK